MDFGEIFSPFVKITMVRLILTLASCFHWLDRTLLGYNFCEDNGGCIFEIFYDFI